MTAKKSRKPPKPEVTSVRVEMRHLRVAGVPPRVARNLFDKHELDWLAFTQEGIGGECLKATDDPLMLKIVDAAVTDAMPTELPNGEVRVYMRHVRAAELCSRGSRAFFTKHNLDWNDFLSNGIPVSTLEKIGDPIALRAAQEAIEEEEANGRQ